MLRSRTSVAFCRPVPDSAALTAEPGVPEALRAAFLTPRLVGTNSTSTLQLAIGAKVAPQLPPEMRNWLEPAPLTDVISPATAAPPLFVTVNSEAGLVAPMRSGPNGWMVGVMLRAPGAMPVPLSEALADPPLVAETCRVADFTPSLAGRNLTVT